MVFDYDRVISETTSIKVVSQGRGRQHPVFRFLNAKGEYICEVRFGGKTANALQRGLWTHTKNASRYFDSITGGWINYSHNTILVKLFAYALVSSSSGHENALKNLQQDIAKIKAEGVK